jgi:hypothetical protein
MPAGYPDLHQQGQDARFRHGDCGHGRKTPCRQAQSFERDWDASADLSPAPDVCGIVHAHPPTATGFAASGYDLNRPLVCEVVVGLGSIPLARYGTPGTPELTDALEPLIPHHDAILMANHGVVTFGSSLESAYMKMETVEHFAKIALVTHLLGNEQPLGEKEVEKLSRGAPPLQWRREYCSSTQAGCGGSSSVR